MRNAIWFKNWVSNKIHNLDDLSVAELIQKFADGKTCRYCEALYGECPDEEDAAPFCNSRLMDWCLQKREEDLSYRGVTGIYRHDEKEKIYRGVTMDGTGDRLIPFYGKSLYELDGTFRFRVDRYNAEIKDVDEEMRKLEKLPAVRVLKDGEITGIIVKDNSGVCHMTLIFRGNVEVAECKDMTVAFDYFHDFVKEKNAEVMENDLV